MQYYYGKSLLLLDHKDKLKIILSGNQVAPQQLELLGTTFKLINEIYHNKQYIAYFGLNKKPENHEEIPILRRNLTRHIILPKSVFFFQSTLSYREIPETLLNILILKGYSLFNLLLQIYNSSKKILFAMVLKNQHPGSSGELYLENPQQVSKLLSNVGNYYHVEVPINFNIEKEDKVLNLDIRKIQHKPHKGITKLVLLERIEPNYKIELFSKWKIIDNNIFFSQFEISEQFFIQEE